MLVEVPTFCNCHECRLPCRGVKMARQTNQYKGATEIPTNGRVLAQFEPTPEFGPEHLRPLCNECFNDRNGAA